MNMQGLRGKTLQELNSELVDIQKAQFNLRMQRATSQLSNFAQFRELRREVARIKTIIRERDLAGKSQ